MKKFAMLLPLIAGSCWGAGGIFVRTLKTAGFGNLSIMCSRSLVSFCILLIVLLLYDRSLLRIHLRDLPVFLSAAINGYLLMNIFSLIEKRRSSESMYDNVLPDSKDIIMDKIRQSALDVRVELGTAQLSFRDIYNLKVDDVIDFSKNKDSDVMVYVEQQPWFKGQLGVHNSNVAVKLHQRVTAEEDLTELLGADTSLEHNHLERV